MKHPDFSRPLRLPAAALVTMLALLLLSACGGRKATPLPEAFPRIDVPEAEYVTVDSTLTPLAVNKAAETRVRPSDGRTQWVDLVYPSFAPSAVYLTLQRVAPDSLDHILKGLALKMQRNTNGAPGELTTILSDGGWDCRMVVTPTTPVCPVQVVAIAPDSAMTLFGTLYLNRPFVEPNDSIRPVIDAVARDLTYMLQCLK